MILCTGAGGFLAGHLIKALLDEGNQVRAVDIKRESDWWQVHKWADNVGQIDLRDRHAAVFSDIDTVYHLAANMGGMSLIGDKKNDAEVMLDNTRIDLETFRCAHQAGVKRFIWTSSACCYPEMRQAKEHAPPLKEEEAYPADPDTAYGWEKLYAERLLAAMKAETFKPLPVRLHNVFGPHGSWTGGREKAPAALCRKVAEAKNKGEHRIKVFGDGQARRSYLYVDDCVKGLMMLAETNETRPINLGSERSVSVDELAQLIAKVADWPVEIEHGIGPEGVRGRNANISRLRELLGWEPRVSLEDGLRETYAWIEKQVAK